MVSVKKMGTSRMARFERGDIMKTRTITMAPNKPKIRECPQCSRQTRHICDDCTLCLLCCICDDDTYEDDDYDDEEEEEDDDDTA